MRPRMTNFLELAARSGCKQLFLGLESVSQSSMKEVAKASTSLRIRPRRQTVHAHGIAVQAGYRFRFRQRHSSDLRQDTVTSSRRLEYRMQRSIFSLPFRELVCDERLEAEGRILTHDWSKYNGRADVVFRPKQMSPEELLAGYDYANRRFYSWRSVCKRLSRSTVGLAWALPLNMAYSLAFMTNSIAEATQPSRFWRRTKGSSSPVGASPKIGS